MNKYIYTNASSVRRVLPADGGRLVLGEKVTKVIPNIIGGAGPLYDFIF